MKPQVKALRNAASQVCLVRQFPFREFMEDRGLEDVLEAAEAGNWSAKSIAAQVLLRCCVTGGKFNNFYVGLLTVVTFLNDRLGPLGQGEQQAFQDLADILAKQATPETVGKWLDTHYPGE
jgi:hypothetical protein